MKRETLIVIEILHALFNGILFSNVILLNSLRFVDFWNSPKKTKQALFLHIFFH